MITGADASGCQKKSPYAPHSSACGPARTIASIASVRARTAAAIAARGAAAVIAVNRHGWRFVADGAVIAAASTRSIVARATGAAVNARTLRRVARWA